MPKNYPAKCVHELFEEQVKKTPDAAAVTVGTQTVTYDQLNRQSNRMAHLLREKGVAADTLVGICMNRSIEMVVAIFAILKAGGAFVPLDPEYPAARLEFMLRDAEMPLVLVHRDTAELMRSREIPSLSVDLATRIRQEPDENLPRHSEPVNLAYVIYTSGSTGQPKGVMISHDAICNHTCWMQEQFPLGQNDRVLQKTSFGFDAAIWEFFSPLSFGAQLFMAKPGGHRDVRYLAQEIFDQQITVLQMVPSVLRFLAEEPQFGNCQKLKRLFCGGEPLSPDLVERVSSILDVAIINLYGPTEATIDTTFWIAPKAETATTIPIGKPIANATVHLLDTQLQPVPDGDVGELCIGGRGLARGYWNRPELTAEKFIANPFSKNAGERLYKTGDLARRLPDGNLEFVGRIDSQVKIRGHRIELGEIESTLRLEPSVSDAVVVARTDASGEKRLFAYVVTPDENASTRLRSFLEAKLPAHMIPATYVCLEEFPQTPSGKIDRNALPTPSLSVAPQQQAAPQSPLEKEIAGIWGELFRIEKIGVNESFFNLGGHSLLAMQIVVRLREKFSVEISMEAIFEGETIERLARRVLQQMLETRAVSEPQLRPHHRLNRIQHEEKAQHETQDAAQHPPERIS